MIASRCAASVADRNSAAPENGKARTPLGPGPRSEEVIGDREHQNHAEREQPGDASTYEVLLDEALEELLLDEPFEAQITEAMSELLSVR